MVHVVANKNAEKEYKIPVTWEVFSTIKVQAETLEKAYDWAQEHLDEIPLGDNTDYVDGSYQISADSPEACEIYNK